MSFLLTLGDSVPWDFVTSLIVPVLLLLLGLIVSYATNYITRETFLPFAVICLVGLGIHVASLYGKADKWTVSDLAVISLGAVVFVWFLSGLWLKTLCIGLFGSIFSTLGASSTSFQLLGKYTQLFSQGTSTYPTLQIATSAPTSPEGIFLWSSAAFFLFVFTTSWSSQYEHWKNFCEDTQNSLTNLVTMDEYEAEGRCTTNKELDKLRKTLEQNPKLLNRVSNQAKERLKIFVNNPRERLGGS